MLPSPTGGLAGQEKDSLLVKGVNVSRLCHSIYSDVRSH